jgi:hypothetical protein
MNFDMTLDISMILGFAGIVVSIVFYAGQLKQILGHVVDNQKEHSRDIKELKKYQIDSHARITGLEAWKEAQKGNGHHLRVEQ